MTKKTASGAGGQVAQASSGAGGQVAQASSGAGPSGVGGCSGAAPAIKLTKKTAQAIGALHQVIKTLEAGRDVVSMEVRTYLGEPRLHSIEGPTFNSCIQITIETNPRAKP